MAATVDQHRKVSRREGARLRGSHRSNVMRQDTLKKFVLEHKLSCFACHGQGPWAKAGTHPKRGAWAVCVNCVRKDKAAS